MSKELTEQWREGKLPVGSYYINLVGDVERVDFFEGLEWERTKNFVIEEVLAPVPSYDEYRELVSDSAELVQKMHILEKKLDIATKALKEIKEHYSPEYNKGGEISHKALKEIDLVWTSAKEEE